jgi:uncharacterized SAM-binding protein YcdF (DUF218 family)
MVYAAPMPDATPIADATSRPAIIIFGAAVRPDGQPSRTLRLRVEAAHALGRRLARPLYLPTGGVGRFGPAEAHVMAGLLREAGVAEPDIRPEPTAHDTVSSVRAIRRMLQGHRGEVFAATSAYHLARCVLLLRLAGLKAQPCPPPPALAAAAWRKRWWWRLREVPAVPWDAAYVLLLRAARRL